MQRYLLNLLALKSSLTSEALFRGSLVVSTLFSAFYGVSPVLAEGEEQTALFGDWGGKKSALEESGLAIESILTTDVISNVSGGVKRRTVVEGNFDLTASLDTEKAELWQGGTVFLYVLGNFGEAATEIVGDTQATSNIEAPETIKLYEAWYN